MLQLHEIGALDVIDLYFLVAKRNGFGIAWAARKIGYKESTARSVLRHAKKYLEQGNKGQGRPRKKYNEDHLFENLRYMLND